MDQFSVASIAATRRRDDAATRRRDDATTRRRDEVTYITMMRHPLDAALSHKDHRANTDRKRMMELRGQVGDPRTGTDISAAPLDDPGDYLRSFITGDSSRSANGRYLLADYVEQARTYWEARHAPNVHLFHYADMWNDLNSEMRQIAHALDVGVNEDRFFEFVEAASLQSASAGNQVVNSAMGNRWLSHQSIPTDRSAATSSDMSAV